MTGRPYDLYIRVSRVGGRENLISPDEQQRRGEELAREKGLTIGEVLIDLDESGGKWDRPGLQEALERVRDGRSAGLIVAWLDRLTRDSEHAARLVREIHEEGGTVYAPDAPSDWTTPEGGLQAGIVFAFAQYTRLRAQAGFARAQEQAIKRGIPIANRAPTGYRKGPDRRLEPDPNAAAVITELFERRALGAGPTELGKFLESHSVTTSQGSASWSKPAVMTVIRNRVYLGELSWGKKGRPGGPLVNTAAHPAIVDEFTWEAAQRPSARPQPPRTGGYMLTGVLRCAACGYSMQGTRTSRGKRIYRCVKRHAGGECPEPARLMAEVVEDAAADMFLSTVEDLEAEGRPQAADLSEFQARYDRAKRQLDEVGTSEAQDVFGARWLDVARDRQQQCDDARDALEAARAATAATGQAVEFQIIVEAWPNLTAADRRELIAAQFDVLALGREQGSYVLAAWPRGTGPGNLSRRGFNRRASLRPIDLPHAGRVVALQNTRPRSGDSVS